MKLTSVGRDTLHKLDQPLKELAYVSNHWGPFLTFLKVCLESGYCFSMSVNSHYAHSAGLVKFGQRTAI